MAKYNSTFKSVCAIVLACMLMAGSAAAMGRGRFPQIRIEAQQARLSPVLLGVCSVFMRIENAGDGDDNLVSARADIPGAFTEIHDIYEGKMIRKERVHIPAKSAVVLRPMSFHIMVFKMPAYIKEGHEFTLHLMFEKSGEKMIRLKVFGTDRRQ